MSHLAGSVSIGALPFMLAPHGKPYPRAWSRAGEGKKQKSIQNVPVRAVTQLQWPKLDGVLPGLVHTHDEGVRSDHPVGIPSQPDMLEQHQFRVAESPGAKLSLPCCPIHLYGRGGVTTAPL